MTDRCSLRICALLAVAALAAGGGLAYAQPPQTRLYSLFPIGVQSGGTVEVRITSGADLEEIRALQFSHAGITAKPKLDAQGQPVDQTFEVTAAADVPEGMYDVQAIGLWGASNPRRFVVGRKVEASETEPNNNPEQAGALPLNTVMNGRMEGGTDVDRFKFTATRGQKIVFNCWAQRIDSRLDSVLDIHDAAGRRLAHARDVRGEDPVLVFEAPADGDYEIRLSDEVFRNGQEYFYRLESHTGPYIALVTPPAGVAGAAATFTAYGFNLPGGQPTEQVLHGTKLEQLPVSITLPADVALLDADGRVTPVQAGEDAFTWRLDSPQGLSNPIRIHLATAPVTVEQEPNNEPPQAQAVTIPCEVCGQFAERGDVDTFRFDAKAGQVCWIEAYGERIGRTVDPYLIVEQVSVDAEGKETVKRLTAVDDNAVNLAQNLFDTQTDDPAFRLAVPADGTYRVSVRDRYWETRGSPSLQYRLAIRGEQPDFRVVAVPAAPVAGQPWPIGLRKGDTFGVTVLAFRRDGFEGPIQVTAEDLPPGVECRGTTIGTKQPSALLVFSSSVDAAEITKGVRLTATAAIDDPPSVRAVEAAKAVLTNAEKPLADLQKGVAAEADKVQKAQQAYDAAKQAADAKADDANLAKKAAEELVKLQAAQAAQAAAAEKLAAGEKAVVDAKANIAQLQQAVAAKVRQVVHPVRSGAIVWPGQNNIPAVSRVAPLAAVTIMKETAPFQVKTDVFQVQANQSRQILVPVTLEKRNEFNDKVALTFTGLPNNSNIDIKNDAIEKDQTAKVLRMFVKDNAAPGTYTVHLAAQGQVSYRRNPEKADRLKAESDAAAATAKTSQEASQAATTAKNEATQKATAATQALQKAQTDKANADKAAAAAKEALTKANEAKAAAEKKAADAVAAVTKADAELAAAKKALEGDAENADLKQKVAAAEQAATAAKTAADAATVEKDAAVKTATEATEAAKKADEAATAAATTVTTADAANKTALEAKTQAEKAEQEAQAKAKADDAAKQAAEKRSNDAANAAKPNNVNFTPPSTPIVITVKAAPIKLAANVPGGGALKKGQKVEVKVTVTRQNGFAGAVAVSLPLPPGVTGVAAEPLTIPADQTEGTLIVTAAGDAKEGALENMVIRGSMEFEGAAEVDVPVTLKVDP